MTNIRLSIWGECTVNTKKLTGQIRREMVSDPKKAVLLGGLLLLACYYWAPLVSGWLSKGDADQQESQLAALAAPTASTPSPSSKPIAPVGPNHPHAPLHRWQTLVRWMDADPRTQPVQQISGRRDAFTDRATHRPIAGDSVDVEDRPVTPANLGMRLTSIMISARRRVALINGKAYVPRDRIEVKLTAEATKPSRRATADDKTNDGRQAETTPVKKPQYAYFILAEVRHRSVLLRRAEKSFELKLPSPKLTGDEFVISYSDRKQPPLGP